MTGTDRGGAPRRRWRLYAPFAALLALALLWSAAWLVLRGRAVAESDAFFARERRAGRVWTCPGRGVAGYPFRLEFSCDSLSFERQDLSFQLGRVVVLAQVYDPFHVVLEAAGPFRVTRGAATGEVTWRLLQASLNAGSAGVERVSLAADEIEGRIEGLLLAADAAPLPIDFASRRIELHGRPTPGRFASDGAVDASLRAEGMLLPVLDTVLGGPEPGDLALDVMVNRAATFGAGPLPVELERWRERGGSLDLTSLSLGKGARRLVLKGSLALDDTHRATGRLEAQAAGLDAILAPILGQRFGERGALIGSLIGGLLGTRRPRDPGAQIEQPSAGAGPALVPLPPVRLERGRILVGPFPLPVALLPLY